MSSVLRLSLKYDLSNGERMVPSPSKEGYVEADAPGVGREDKGKAAVRGSTKYKEKFQTLRDRYDEVLSMNDQLTRDLDAGNAVLRRIQREKDLLLDVLAHHHPQRSPGLFQTYSSDPMYLQTLQNPPHHPHPFDSSHQAPGPHPPPHPDDLEYLAHEREREYRTPHPDAPPPKRARRNHEPAQTQISEYTFAPAHPEHESVSANGSASAGTSAGPSARASRANGRARREEERQRERSVRDEPESIGANGHRRRRAT